MDAEFVAIGFGGKVRREIRKMLYEHLPSSTSPGRVRNRLQSAAHATVAPNLHVVNFDALRAREPKLQPEGADGRVNFVEQAQRLGIYGVLETTKQRFSSSVVRPGVESPGKEVALRLCKNHLPEQTIFRVAKFVGLAGEKLHSQHPVVS